MKVVRLPEKNPNKSCKYREIKKMKGRGGKSSYLKQAEGYDPESAIREVQDRIDAEGRKVSFFKKPIFYLGLLALAFAGGVAAVYYQDQKSTENSIDGCINGLSKGNRDKETQEMCRTAAAAGNMRAVAGLAAIYVSAGRNDLAFPYLKTCASDNNGDCQYLLSAIYRDGISGILDANQLLASQLLVKAEENGSHLAAYTLFKAYDEGSAEYLIKKNRKEASRHLRKAAEMGNPAALYQVSLNYRNGEYGFVEDFEKSVDNLKEAADKGYSEAIGQYALFLLETDNYEAAEGYLKKGEALREPLSCSLAAQMYRNGTMELALEEPAKTERLIELFSIGAEADNAMAIRNLIEIYHDLEDSGNYIKWIRRALGMNMAEANGYMGQALEEGFVIEAPQPATDQTAVIIHQILENNPDLETAVQYYRRGAAQHDNRSYNRLLQIYQRPEFKNKLNSDFFSLSKNYAEVEPEHGLEMLAYCHNYGIGTPVNEKAAHDLLAEKIANFGDLKLAVNVTRKLLTGTSKTDVPVSRNPKAAPRFATMLLDMGDTGKAEYLKIWQDMLNSPKQEDRLAVLNIVNSIPDEYQTAMSDDDSYLFLKLKTNLLYQKPSGAALEKMKQTADMLLLREHHDTEIFYADMAYDGKGFFSKPDYDTALAWYEAGIKDNDKPDGTVLFRIGNIYSDKASRKNYAKGLDYLKRALSDERDLAMDLIISRYIQDDKNKEAVSLLTDTEKYYYLKLAEMTGRNTKQTNIASEKIKKKLNEDEISETEQKVYEEMVRRKALEKQRKAAGENNRTN